MTPHPTFAHLKKIATAKDGDTLIVAEPITVRKFSFPDTYNFPIGTPLLVHGDADMGFLTAFAPLDGGETVVVGVPSELYGRLEIMETMQ